MHNLANYIYLEDGEKYYSIINHSIILNASKKNHSTITFYLFGPNSPIIFAPNHQIVTMYHSDFLYTSIKSKSIMGRIKFDKYIPDI